MPYVTSTMGRRGYVYFPLKTSFYPVWKVVITDQDDTDYTIADFTTGTGSDNYLLEANVTRSVTDKLGSAVVRFANPVNSGTQMCQFVDKFTGGETINIYADYDDASALIFRGQLDNVKNGVDSTNSFFIEVDARDYPEMTDITVIGSAIFSKADVTICDILDEAEFSDVTLCFWNGSTWAEATFDSDTREVTWDESVDDFPADTVTLSWQNRKPWNIIKEVCQRVGLECYMEYDGSKWCLRTFLTDGIQNNGFSCTLGQNIITFPSFGPENTAIKNQVTVYGAKESTNVLSIATEVDEDSQDALWRKYLTITAQDLTTNEEVRQRASYELSQATKDTTSGNMTIVGEETVKPGEQVMVGIPQLNISGYYTVRQFTHSINSSGYKTAVVFQRTNNRVEDLFKPKIDIEKESEAFENLNAMTDSVIIRFDETESYIDDHDGTEEVGGKLQLTGGQTQGVATTVIFDTKIPVSVVEVRKYSNFPIDEDDTYEVSNDGGVTWYDYVIGSGQTLTFPLADSSLRLRMTLNRTSVDDPTPSYESICIMYKE